MLIAHDIEVMKGKEKYLVSDNPITYQGLKVIGYDVEGAGYERDYSAIDSLNGRFLTCTREEKKKATLTLRYDVQTIAQASQLKSRVQHLFSGELFLRELAANDNTIPFLQMDDEDYEFELDYVDGRQLFVGLTSNVSFDTTKTQGTFTLDFETLELPYFESIYYSTEIEKQFTDEELDMFIDFPIYSEDKRKVATFKNTTDDFLYYFGDVPIDQFNQDMVVEITLGQDTKDFTFDSGVKSELMRIRNINLKAGDKIKYDGLQTYRNGMPINEKKHVSGNQPSLQPGYNHFHFNQKVQKVVFKYKLYWR